MGGSSSQICMHDSGVRAASLHAAPPRPAGPAPRRRRVHVCMRAHHDHARRRRGGSAAPPGRAAGRRAVSPSKRAGGAEAPQPSMAEGSWTTFHQQEDLTTRLHNILEEYPPGIGIFKEFLQNADDAGARKFAIVFDRRHHPQDPAGLFSPAMAGWQGPALCVYNDATFTAGDFESISHVGRSGKHDDVQKIGKYGLGT